MTQAARSFTFCDLDSLVQGASILRIEPLAHRWPGSWFLIRGTLVLKAHLAR